MSILSEYLNYLSEIPVVNQAPMNNTKLMSQNGKQIAAAIRKQCYGILSNCSRQNQIYDAQSKANPQGWQMDPRNVQIRKKCTLQAIACMRQGLAKCKGDPACIREVNTQMGVLNCGPNIECVKKVNARFGKGVR